jgi:hypothetical protein
MAAYLEDWVLLGLDMGFLLYGLNQGWSGGVDRINHTGWVYLSLLVKRHEHEWGLGVKVNFVNRCLLPIFLLIYALDRVLLFRPRLS